MAFRIVDCDDAQIPALRSFFGRVYRPDYALCDAALLRWQFQRTPGSDGRQWHIKLALHDAGIAGCLGYIPLDISLPGRVARGAWVINWIVDAAHRQLGLGPLLMRDVMQQFEVTMNVGPNQVARDTLSRMGWWSFGDLPRHVVVLDRASAVALAKHEQLRWPEAAIEAARVVPSASARIDRVERFGPGVTSLWEGLSAISGHDVAGSRRSAEFLNWRYADHPHFRYRLFVRYEGAHVTGLAVYRNELVRGMPIRVGRLLEYLDATEGDERRSDLLAHVLQHARSAGISVLDFFCADHRLAGRLACRGFIADKRVTSALPVLLQPIDRQRTGIPFMVHAGKRGGVQGLPWYVTKGDGDQDRPN